MNTARFTINALAAAVISVASFAAMPPVPAMAKTVDIAVIVNNIPITNDDIAKRRNLLRLMGNRNASEADARKAMIDQTLQQAEIAFRGMSVNTNQVDAAFANFAKGNKMSVSQMEQILNQAGVGAEHFKFYIAISMSWKNVLSARFGGNNMLSDEKFIPQLEAAEKAGNKPHTNEYLLKRIVFVVPEKERNSILAKRKREAEASRSKFPGCDGAISFAATMNDVTVLDMGRYLEPQLPDVWKDAVIKAKGDTTSIQTTPYGVEYLAICEKKETDDDYAARLILSQKEDTAEQDYDKENKTYMTELEKKASIVTPGK